MPQCIQRQISPRQHSVTAAISSVALPAKATTAAISLPAPTTPSSRPPWALLRVTLRQQVPLRPTARRRCNGRRRRALGSLWASTFNGQGIPWAGSGAATVTLANNAPAGTECLISCEGAGQITFVAQAGASMQSRGARFKSNGQYSLITALVISNSGTNAAWRLGGDLTT